MNILFGRYFYARAAGIEMKSNRLIGTKSADLGIKNGQKHKKCDFFVFFLQKVLENEKKLLPLHSQNR